MDFFKTKNLNKKWTISIITAIVLCITGIIFFYYKNNTRVFTRSEYIKEVVIQNQNFNNLLDEFLDKVDSYSGSKESIDQLENSANKITRFTEALKEQLGPKVPSDSKSHYEGMIKAYNMYIDSIELYKKAVPKNLGEERTSLMNQAQEQLTAAQKEMKNLQ